MKRPEDDLDRELSSHLELAALELGGDGVPEGEARRRARVAFGNAAAVAEDVRAVWHWRWLADLRQDVRFGLRQLARKPGFALVAMLTLALGIGANTAMFSITDAALWRALPYPHPEQLVEPTEVEAKNPEAVWGATYPTFRDWQAKATSFEHLAATYTFVKTLRGTGGEPVRLNGLAVTYDYFEVLEVQPALGRVLTAQDDRVGAPLAMVLSHRMWAERLRSDPAALGRTLDFAGLTFTVVGVMPAGFDDGVTECWVPLVPLFQASFAVRRNLWAISTIGRLRPGRTAAEAQAELEGIMGPIRLEYPSTNRGFVMAVPSLRASTTGDIGTALLVLLAAAGLVLLIACANMAVLISLRMAGRGTELALRAALGAGRRRLIAQLLTESALLSAGGGVAGVGLAYWATRSLPALSHDPRLLHASINLPVLGFALSAAVATTVLAGVMPAYQHAKEALKTRHGGQRRQTALQRSLVVAEIALSLVLLLGAGLLVKTLRNVLHVDAGFRTGHLVVMQLGLPAAYSGTPLTLRFYRDLPARLGALPGVTAATVVSSLPLGGGEGNGDISIEGRASGPGQLGAAGFHHPLPGYFQTMGIPLLRGRDFDERDDGTRDHVVIISEHMAETLWPKTDPVGKRMKVGPPESNPWLTIIGVVGNVHRGALDDELGFTVYLPLLEGAGNNEDVAVRTSGNTSMVTAEVREELRRMEPSLLISHLGTMDRRIEDSVSPRRLNLTLFGLFAGLALLLASVGLYGVIAFAVGQRTREFGIRMALGAQRGQVLRQVLKQGVELILAGLIVGMVIALGLGGLMQKMLFGVRPTDPATMAAVAILLAGIALVACWFPAYRATRIEPTQALRNQ